LYHHWDYKAAIYETAFNPSFILSAKSESVLDRTPNPLTGIDQEGRNDSTQSTMASQCPVAIETDDKEGECLHKTFPLLAKFGQWIKLTFYKVLILL